MSPETMMKREDDDIYLYMCSHKDTVKVDLGRFTNLAIEFVHVNKYDDDDE